MSQQVKDYLHQNRNELLKKLTDFLAIPSISTDSSHKDDVVTAGKFVVQYLEEMGFNNVELQETAGHPLVYGEWLEADDAPTVLFLRSLRCSAC